jgi:hypothetical protein
VVQDQQAQPVGVTAGAPVVDALAVSQDQAVTLADVVTGAPVAGALSASVDGGTPIPLNAELRQIPLLRQARALSLRSATSLSPVRKAVST